MPRQATRSKPATAHVLHPGDVAWARAGGILETLLGSCIAVVLTDPRRTLGAMCHVVHGGAAPRGVTATTAYADPAIDRLYELLLKQAIVPRLCEAYVYGGGNMFSRLIGAAQGHVGERNRDAVSRRLERDGVRILHADTGGTAYRKLRWVVGPDAPQVIAVDMGWAP